MAIHLSDPIIKKSKSSQHYWVRLLIVAVVVVYGALIISRPLATIAADQPSLTLTSAPQPSLLQWPTAQAAVGLVGSSILDTHGTQTALPTASTAKLITALTVLRQRPISPGQAGATLILTPTDVAFYNQYTAEDGSVVPVQAGEQISEYQVLQAMMLPSANNMADTLANWAFGSLPAYATAANSYLKTIGLTNTFVGTDGSGFDPSTTSTAADLVKLGETAISNPILAQIVGQSSATIPVAGVIHNVNFLLGQQGIIGIKTGNTDQAGGVFVSASQIAINGHSYTIVTAVLGAANLYDALAGSKTLISSAQKNFSNATIVTKGTVVGRYTSHWGSTSSAVAAQTISTFSWRGITAKAQATLSTINGGAQKGQIVGSIIVPASQTSPAQSGAITLQNDTPKPPLLWRLTHPLS
jgi:D-alanyl-D-alanine carboxypeptidase (penicillin-binding protein 5/6)